MKRRGFLAAAVGLCVAPLAGLEGDKSGAEYFLYRRRGDGQTAQRIRWEAIMPGDRVMICWWEENKMCAERYLAMGYLAMGSPDLSKRGHPIMLQKITMEQFWA